ncbi:MAG TPA: hypothetical protein VNX68_08980, partial [Nitrosopumilaceae archaeon]|nr:hypothetical protein [Nitrosopumilaceae archaeon]
MKTTTIKKAACILSTVCLMGFGASAQYVNNFFHINGLASDHGQGAKVITTKADPSYIVGGASSSSFNPFFPQGPN